MTDTDTRNAAAEYAASIAEEMRTWERAATGDPDAMDALADDMAGIVDIELGGVPHGDDYIQAVALAVTVWRTEPDTDGMRETRIEILRTYGGPSCRIEWDSRQPARFTVFAAWGSDYATADVYAPTLGASLEDVYQ